MTHACRYSEFLLSLGTSTLDITCYTYEINGYYVADYLSFGINCTLICVSVYFSFVSFPRRCNACTIWIYIYPKVPVHLISRSTFPASVCPTCARNECIHGSIDLEKRVWDFNIGQVPLTSHVHMPACWPLSSRASNTFLRFRSENIELDRDIARYMRERERENEKILKASIVN